VGSGEDGGEDEVGGSRGPGMKSRRRYLAVGAGKRCGDVLAYCEGSNFLGACR